MPLVVPCPGCPTKLSAPESAAGKQIRCPKCKAVVPVPAFVPAEEVPVVDAKVTAPPPVPKPAPKSKPVLDTTTTFATCGGCASTVCVIGTITDGLIHCPNCGFATPVPKKPGSADDEDDEDEDERPRKKRSRRDEEEDEDERPRKKKRRSVLDGDEDEEEDRPRKRKRKPVGSGGGGGRVIFFVLLGVLFLGLCGVGIYLLFGRAGGVFAKKAPVPAGWKEYSNPQSGFKAYFPGEPSVFGANMPGGFGGGVLPGGVEVPQLESMHSYTAGGGFGARGGPIVSVEINRYSTPIPRASRDLMTRNGNNRFAGGNVKRVRWLGGDAAEVETGGAVLRLLVLEKVVVLAQVSGPNGGRAKPEEIDGFFDNFELTK